MSTTNAKVGTALERRPNLWWTESRLGEALVRLEMADPDEQMSEDDAVLFVAGFVSPGAVTARRDEFAAFVLEAEAMVAAKLQQAAAIHEQAERIANGVKRMRAQAVKVMQAAKVKMLAGEAYTLKLKDSPGAVVVDDEAQIPAEFWRTREDDDLAAIERLLTIAKHHAAAGFLEAGAAGDVVARAVEDDEMIREGTAIAEAARARRRAVDKKAIQAEWKANGETREEVDPETGEVIAAPMVPGARKQVDTKLVIG